MVLRSRTAPKLRKAGAEIEVAGGHAREVAPCGCPVGTTIEVHNLFYNTPVRRKFLRTPQTEFGHISEAFTRIALALPRVHFTLRHNERQVFDLPASGQRGGADRGALRPRTGRAADLRAKRRRRGADFRLRRPSQPEPQQQPHAVLFLNGRHIRDSALQHALAEAYRGLLMVGRYAIAFLSIEMPADMVDVNVHPTKLEVRFRDGGRLYSQLLSTLRSKFLTTDLTTLGQAPPGRDRGQRRPPTTRPAPRKCARSWSLGPRARWPTGSRASEGGAVAAAAAGLATADAT